MDFNRRATTDRGARLDRRHSVPVATKFHWPKTNRRFWRVLIQTFPQESSQVPPQFSMHQLHSADHDRVDRSQTESALGNCQALGASVQYAHPTDHRAFQPPVDLFVHYDHRYCRSIQSQRDLSLLIAIGLYVLNIIDANVDAHLKQYNISNTLSVDYRPFLEQNDIGVTQVGMKMQISF